MFIIFTLIAVTMAVEYIQLEYNKGSYEIVEINKCYCYKNIGCYKYDKTEDKKTVKEYEYKGKENCDSTVQPKDYLVGQFFDGIKYTIIEKLPEHQFHYIQSNKDDCTDEKERAKVLIAKDNCEIDFYAEPIRYHKFTLDEINKKVNIVEYSDEACQNPKFKEGEQIVSTLETNQCNQIEGEGSYGIFIPSEVSNENDEYLQLEYGTGSFEIYEFDKCYCYGEEGCFKYEKVDATKFNEYEYAANSNCVANPEPEPTEIVLAETEKPMKYSIITTLPQHIYHYFVSPKGDCTDQTDMSVVLLAENHCELDYYSYTSEPSVELYNKYEIVDGQVTMKEYKDAECQIPNLIPTGNEIASTTVKMQECLQIEGKGAHGIFLNNMYTLHGQFTVVQVEYNKGVYGIYEFATCYCFPEEGCYYYLSIDSTRIKKLHFGEDSTCLSAEPTTTEYTLGQKGSNDIIHTVTTKIPIHDFKFTVYKTNECKEEEDHPVYLFAEEHCEVDHNIPGVYRTYSRTNFGRQVIIRQFSDNTCTTQNKEERIPVELELEANTCSEVKGVKVKINSNTYEKPKEEVLQIEYNKGVYELYEFGKCYCFSEEGCYKYEKVDATKVKELYYEESSNCESSEPTTTEYTVGQKGSDLLTYTIITELPTHQFQYTSFMTNECNIEEGNHPLSLMTEDNCDVDYIVGGIYRTYRLSQDGKSIEIKQFSDNTCTTPKIELSDEKIEVNLEYDKCVEYEGHKVKFNSKKYEVPSGSATGGGSGGNSGTTSGDNKKPDNGSVGTFILTFFLVVLFFF